MAKKTRSVLKSYFETGDVPNQGQYVNLIDSFVTLEDSSTQIIKGPLSASSILSATNVFAGAYNSYLVPAEISQSYWVTSSTENTLYREAGNIGINTSKAPKTLTVHGDISASGIVYARRFESSGSGNSIDIVDSVDITGNLTASGDISASGTGSFGSINVTSFPNVHSSTHITSSGNISASGAVTASVGHFTKIINVNTTNVTASGKVSASGDISTTNYFLGNISSSKGIFINITSSGDISSSNTIKGLTGSFELVGGTLTTAAQTNVTSLGTLTGLNVNSHITASGNISASGNVYSGFFGRDEGETEVKGDIITFTSDANQLFKFRQGATQTFTIGPGLGYITASGNVSASGDLEIRSITSSNSLLTSNYVSASEIRVKGNITASGHISGSGTSTGSFGMISTVPIYTSSFGQISASGTITATDFKKGTLTIPNVHSTPVANQLTYWRDNNQLTGVPGMFIGTGTVGAITSSGAISSSKTITGNSGSFNAVEVKGNLTASGTIIANNFQTSDDKAIPDINGTPVATQLAYWKDVNSISAVTGISIGPGSVGAITASGDISSSHSSTGSFGKITAKGLFGISNAGVSPLRIESSNITISGSISSSHNLTVKDIVAHKISCAAIESTGGFISNLNVTQDLNVVAGNNVVYYVNETNSSLNIALGTTYTIAEGGSITIINV